MFAEIVDLFPKFNDDAEELKRQNRIIEEMKRESSKKELQSK